LKPIDEGEEMTAVITEAQRFEMHTCLRGLMGEEVANTMMEHLPPSGGSDVARKSDIELLQKGADRLEKRVDHLVAGMWTLGFITATGFIGVYAQIATKF
jgi:hypothetical protein